MVVLDVCRGSDVCDGDVKVVLDGLVLNNEVHALVVDSGVDEMLLDHDLAATNAESVVEDVDDGVVALQQAGGIATTLAVA